MVGGASRLLVSHFTFSSLLVGMEVIDGLLAYIPAYVTRLVRQRARQT